MKIKINDRYILTFVIVYHVLLIALLPAFMAVFSWSALGFCLFTYIIAMLSITAGYHRLYAHKAFSAHPFYEWCVLIGSCLAYQFPVIEWAHDHRLHHNHVDTEKDPHSIKKGFWYAHILWLFDYKRDFDERIVADLLKNPRVVFQDKYYDRLVIATNLAFFGLGCIFFSPFVSFYAGCLLRLALIHHSTWFVNSLCHTIGAKTYARELSAVDNVVVAVLTFGEGYHNYHHVFPADYRNGIRWYHFDPTKWSIWLASKLGLTKNLHTSSTINIQKTLIRKDKKELLEHLSKEVGDVATEIKAKLEHLADIFEENATKLTLKLRELKQATGEDHTKIQDEIKAIKTGLKKNWKEWVALTRLTSKQFHLVH